MAMKDVVLDLHIHSKYSRACSKDLVLPNIAEACAVRGIDVVVTGDFTHPAWFKHLEETLIPDTDGLYRVKGSTAPTRFLIGTEVASVRKHAGATRRVHHLLFAPSLEVAKKFNERLQSEGINLKADGRPIIGRTSKEILQMMLDTDPSMVMIPAHAWTPWFGVFGSKGGYTSLEECYEELTPHIFAIETGLSSDPHMNARLSKLDGITLISNSDAHSPQKLGREANVLRFENDAAVTYSEIMRIFREQDSSRFAYTIEFYPEEGKYHLDGHRECGVVMEPEETKRRDGVCPKCGRQVTFGVLHRVCDLADRNEKESANKRKVPHKSIVPLIEIVADTLDLGVAAKATQALYKKLVTSLKNEFHILLHALPEDIESVGGKEIRNAIERVRSGNIAITPGYDGEFGVVKVFGEHERRLQKQDTFL